MGLEVMMISGVMVEATQVDEITEHTNKEKQHNNKILDDGKSKES